MKVRRVSVSTAAKVLAVTLTVDAMGAVATVVRSCRAGSFRRTVIGLALIFSLVLVGCAEDRDPPGLSALKADPMATAEIPGLSLIAESEVPEGEAMGKPILASVTREFRVTLGTQRSIIRAVKRLAESNGWKEFGRSSPTSYYAKKILMIDGVRIIPAADLTVVFGGPKSALIELTQEC